MKLRNRLSLFGLLLFTFSIAVLPVGCGSSGKPNADTVKPKDSVAAPKDTVVRGLNYAGFVKLTGLDSSQASYLPEMWKLWKAENWDALDTLVTTKKLNGLYPPAQGFQNVDTVTLAVDTKLDRYGWNSGRFVAPQGEPFANRALPERSLKSPYHRFKVIEAIPSVLSGKSIPWFGQPGGGQQYMFADSVGGLILKKFLVMNDSLAARKK